jgi:isopentenyldiphosphate isomerase
VIDHQEEWQVFSSNGEILPGESITPDYARGGAREIVGAVHVWIWRCAGNGLQVLLQRRAKTKPTWPDHLDISVAGHIDARESKLQAAVREGQEEIGIKLETDRLDYIFSYRNFDNGFKWVYLYEEETPQEYIFNDGEVDELNWVDFEAFKSMIQSPADNQLVPHPIQYYELLVRALDENH